MKTAFFALAVILTIIIFSCSDNSVTTTTVASYPLSGKIDNWNFGSMKLVAEVFDSSYIYSARIDSCTIGTDGSFALNLKAPPSQVLSTISNIPSPGCYGSINVNPPDAKFTMIQFSVYDSARHQFGVVSRQNYDSVFVNGSFVCDYLYCDRSVTMGGTMYCILGQDTTFNTYSWSGINNWNKVVSTFTVDTRGFVAGATMTNNEPAGASWRFHKNPYDAKKGRLFK